MSVYSNLGPLDPETLRFLRWLIEVADPVVTEFDVTVDRDVAEVGSAFDRHQRYVPVGQQRVTVELTMFGYLPDGAEYQSSTGRVQGLPVGTKALP